MVSRRLAVLVVALSILAVGSSPGSSFARERIVMHGGDVVVMRASLAPSDCPLDYVCLWENPDFIGGMVAYRDCCAWNNLANVGFNNVASSWRNRKGVDAKVANFADGNGALVCLNNGSQAGSMGGFDNQATSIKVFSSSGAC